MDPALVLSSVLSRPRLRGVIHLWAFVAAVAGGVFLILTASGAEQITAVSIYAASLAGLFGVSAAYHRIRWSREAAHAWMRRVDHSMIFVLIAGSYTPFALLVLEGPMALAVLIGVWTGAAAGIVMQMAWIAAPRWLSSLVYVLLGWVAIAAFPGLLDGLGLAGTLLVAGGGVLYTVGAVIYALRRPDPVPTVFGYHEVFHALVVLAAGLQYAVVAGWVL